MTKSFAEHMALPHSWLAVRAQLDAGSRQLSVCARAEDRIDWEVEHPDVVADYYGECAYLGTLIKDAHLKMLLLIDQLSTPSFLAAYRKGFRKYRGKLTEVVRIEFDPEIRESEALRYVRSAFNTLSDSMEPRRSAHEVDAIAQVERLLRSTHYIVARAGVEPKAESDIEVALFDYLRILYPTARRQVPIAHVIKTFKADIGIDELGVLIEIKFVDSAREVKSECPSLYEDMFGYRGDPKWTSLLRDRLLDGPRHQAGRARGRIRHRRLPGRLEAGRRLGQGWPAGARAFAVGPRDETEAWQARA